MKKILIIKHGSLGDVILSLYSIFAIKKHFQNSNITILTEDKYYEIFKFIPLVDNIKFDNRPKIYDLFSLGRLFIWFYKEKFDWVFDLQTSSRTNMYFFIFSLFNKFKWNGIAKKCSHPHINPKRTKLHTLDRQRDQLKMVGIKSSLKINWNFLKTDISRFKLKKNLILLVIGGSSHRPEKMWSINNYINLIKYLNKKKICPVLIGGKEEEKFLSNRNLANVTYKNLIAKTNFLDLAEIARKSYRIVGNDTGPMHLLVQCSKPETKKIVLFGSHSDPELCAPKGKNVFIIQKKNINNILLEEVVKLLD